MHPNEELINRFYTAFQDRDGAAMAACYHPDASFSDPAFPSLKSDEPGWMWRMLTERGEDLKVEFRDAKADDSGGTAHWDADYTFSTTGRSVHNSIDATFTFKEGVIFTHVDDFNFHTWSKQALGLPGLLLGWTPFLQKKVNRTARAQLDRFMQKRKEP